MSENIPTAQCHVVEALGHVMRVATLKDSPIQSAMRELSEASAALDMDDPETALALKAIIEAGDRLKEIERLCVRAELGLCFANLEFRALRKSKAA